MARTILKQMERPTIDLCDMVGWEAKLVRMLIRKVEGVPVFVAWMVDQYGGVRSWWGEECEHFQSIFYASSEIGKFTS